MNILSGLSSSPSASPPRSRTASEANIQALGKQAESDEPNGLGFLDSNAVTEKLNKLEVRANIADGEADDGASEIADNERAPLLAQEHPGYVTDGETKRKIRWAIPKRLAAALANSIKIVLSTVLAPGRYIIACFYDEQGHFSAVLPIRKLGILFGRKRKATAQKLGQAGSENQEPRFASRTRGGGKKISRPPSVASSAVTSDEEPEIEHGKRKQKGDDSPARHTRSKSIPASTTESEKPTRKIRIKDTQTDSFKKRKKQKAQSGSGGKDSQPSAEAAAILKSPTSPATSSSLKVTRYPRAPAPPRPLIPRRQPSYTVQNPGYGRVGQKTLIIDLDETLIHSMAKGGRMSTGHMVEVKLSQPVGAGGVTLAPQIPILYYVHKRPHCDEFLRKVCKWYNLIVFTASVQEYADPVIDWLEQERKYFSGRYYRQHCTFRNGAYIKDLAQVEPDLSKVMILDNSPMSYIFHEDNAIPIEGWINDPTDNDLLHLIPLLEGLQYVTDVRALLALRLGETQPV
ncbi:MAG: Nuclear envelope morphology protein 1 [Bogoriella megaspora]|nr:MAG: Nuclear envelope morphology protein 1 [Bogoriella megaspora]